ncbi:hypothetical protein EMCRGX_G003924 [Ephydatia muelleri]
MEAGVTSGSAALTADVCKHNANDAKCSELGWTCIPIEVETYGCWGAEAMQTLSRLASRLATRGNCSKSHATSAGPAELPGERLSTVLLHPNNHKSLLPRGHRPNLALCTSDRWLYVCNPTHPPQPPGSSPQVPNSSPQPHDIPLPLSPPSASNRYRARLRHRPPSSSSLPGRPLTELPSPTDQNLQSSQLPHSQVPQPQSHVQLPSSSSQAPAVISPAVPINLSPTGITFISHVKSASFDFMLTIPSCTLSKHPLIAT